MRWRPRLTLQRLHTLPVHLGSLLHVVELQEECVEIGFWIHGWRVATGINRESTMGHRSLSDTL